ncbi:MAG: hypothetical protein CM15mV69_520 [Caudoviricetes sp.]|nr:MAG: hypothetical protein CM15mV69_520 [Caudoviricetes sp.]
MDFSCGEYYGIKGTQIFRNGKNSFVQQYKKKITHLSQQGYGKKKFNLEKLEHERIPKKTSIGRRPR